MHGGAGGRDGELCAGVHWTKRERLAGGQWSMSEGRRGREGEGECHEGNEHDNQPTPNAVGGEDASV